MAAFNGSEHRGIVAGTKEHSEVRNAIIKSEHSLKGENSKKNILPSTLQRGTHRAAALVSARGSSAALLTYRTLR